MEHQSHSSRETTSTERARDIGPTPAAPDEGSNCHISQKATSGQPRRRKEGIRTKFRIARHLPTIPELHRRKGQPRN